jgi:hypothetical protein
MTIGSSSNYYVLGDGANRSEFLPCGVIFRAATTIAGIFFYIDVMLTRNKQVVH